jgi:enoyl-CoA hydratase
MAAEDREAVLLVADAGRVRTLTINRPDRHNALNGEVFAALDEELDRAAAAADVGIVVFAGAGSRSFSAGADLGELAGLGAVPAKRLLARGQGVFRKLEALPKPTVAAVGGNALGGGFELALSCTFILCSTSAKFGLPEVGLGLIPGYGGTQRLPAAIGRAAALKMMLSGAPIRAEEAYRLGLVAEAPLDPEELPVRVAELAATIAAGSSSAQQSILEAATRSLGAGLGLETNLAGLAISSAQGREGVAAFLEKRPADFSESD